jgi:C4-dicarboxylate-specific signal transduction histidine kinase
VRATRQADRSLLRLGRRAAGLAHDLGKPLFVVEHVARRALQRTLDPAARGDVEILLVMAAEMRGALRDFLHELRREPVPEARAPLAALVARALDVVGPAHGRARVRLRLDRDAALAPAPERLVRPLVNLLENALLAAPPDSRVELRAWLRRDALRVEVADRGPGLAAAVVAGAFALAHAPEPGRGGIGLAASRDLLRDLGGRLGLASDPARGTRARIALPHRRVRARASGARANVGT